MRVLIVKTSSIGDILHTLPSLTDAMRVIPDIRFDWVIEEDFSQIPTWHKSVNLVIPVSIRRWRKSWFFMSVKAACKVFYQTVCTQYYDVIIDAQGLLKSAVLVRSVIGVKHGMDWKTVREPIASLFYDYCHHIDKRQHAVERIRDLFSKSLCYSKPQTCGDYGVSQNLPYKTVLNNRIPYLVFIHATTLNDKHWPETHWRKLIELIQPDGIHIKLPWGTEHEKKRAERLAAGFIHVEVLPKLSLVQIAEELAGALVVVSVDTGLSHLTAILDKPNITLFGPTDPNLVGGYGKNQYQIVSPTKKMRDITADETFMLLRQNYMMYS